LHKEGGAYKARQVLLYFAILTLEQGLCSSAELAHFANLVAPCETFDCKSLPFMICAVFSFG
jgi:hypothetical protein